MGTARSCWDWETLGAWELEDVAWSIAIASETPTRPPRLRGRLPVCGAVGSEACLLCRSRMTAKECLEEAVCKMERGCENAEQAGETSSDTEDNLIYDGEKTPRGGSPHGSPTRGSRNPL